MASRHHGARRASERNSFFAHPQRVVPPRIFRCGLWIIKMGTARVAILRTNMERNSH